MQIIKMSLMDCIGSKVEYSNVRRRMKTRCTVKCRFTKAGARYFVDAAAAAAAAESKSTSWEKVKRGKERDRKMAITGISGLLLFLNSYASAG